MRNTPTSRRLMAVPAAAAALILALGVVSPAMGGPSLRGVAKQAKKALKAARKADRRSKQALAEAKKPGPAGPQGATGPRGATGARGPSGATNVTARTASAAMSPTPATVTAACPTGQKATGGGAFWTGGPANINTQVLESYPAVDAAGTPAGAAATPRFWTARGVNNTGAARSLEVRVVCSAP